MYAPAPARPKKTDITRTRAGCVACRRKRRKCDETKPSCRRCVNSNAVCEYTSVLEFRDVTQWAARRVRHSSAHRSSQPILSPISLETGEGCGVQRRVPTTAGPGSPFRRSTEAGSSPRASDKASPALPSPGAARSDICSQLFFDDAWFAVPSPEAQHAWQRVDVQSLDTLAARPYDAPAERQRAPDSLDIHRGPLALTPTPIESLVDLSHGLILHGEEGEPLCMTWSSDSMHTWPETHIHEPEPQSTVGTAASAAAVAATPPSSRGSCLLHGANVPVCEGQHAAMKLVIPDVPVGDRLYLAHFRVKIMSSFPVKIEALWELVVEAPPVRYAALALAAASLANERGAPEPDIIGTWAPMRSHLAKASDFSRQSLGLEAASSRLPLRTWLVLLILRLCYQFEAGSIAEMHQALGALDAGFLQQRDEVLSMPSGPGLARAWLHFRILSSIMDRPHAPIGAESDLETLAAEFERRVATNTLTISAIGSSALRVSDRILMTKCMSSHGSSAIETKGRMSEWWSILKGEEVDDATEPHSTVLTEDALFDELIALKARLRACKAPSGLPLQIDAHVDAVPLASGAGLEPLRFASHAQAMDCADYVFAHVVCDDSILRELTSDSGGSTTTFPGVTRSDHPWLRLLLRIAAGLDVAGYARHCMYRKSMSTYLYHAARLCGSREAFAALDAYLGRIVQSGAYYEGPFSPCYAFMLFSATLQKEMRRGYLLFMASMSYPSSTERRTLLSKGTTQYLIICGREANGRYFDDLVPLTEDCVV